MWIQGAMHQTSAQRWRQHAGDLRDKGQRLFFAVGLAVLAHLLQPLLQRHAFCVRQT